MSDLGPSNPPSDDLLMIVVVLVVAVIVFAIISYFILHGKGRIEEPIQDEKGGEKRVKGEGAGKKSNKVLEKD